MWDAYQRETRAIQKAKDLFLNSVRILSADVFEAYHKDHYTYRMQYLEFPASRYAEEIRAKGATNQELEAFYKTDVMVQQMVRGTANVSAEFVSFDPAAKPSNATPDASISTEDALAYYQKNKARLDTLIPSDERASLTPSATVPLSELKTPFQILMKHGIIAREVQLSAKMQKAFAEAKKPGADLRTIAETQGLSYDKIEKVDRDAMMARYGRFGPQIFSQLFNQNPGDLSPDLRVEPQIQFFYRLTAKEGATLPDFDKVHDQILKPYIETTSFNRARQAGYDFRLAMDKAIDAEVKGDEDKVKKEEADAAEAEIKAGNITDPKRMDDIRNRHQVAAQNRMRGTRDAITAKHFLAQVKAFDVKLMDTGPFEVSMIRRELSGEGEEAARRRYVVTNPLVKGMEPGTVSQVLTDSASRTHFILYMAERAEPDYSTMSDGDLLQMRSQTERARMFQPVQRWQYQDISRRRDLRVNP
jgi:hypothetical protein